jgi:anti-sigma B factor antagonist
MIVKVRGALSLRSTGGENAVRDGFLLDDANCVHNPHRERLANSRFVGRRAAGQLFFAGGVRFSGTSSTGADDLTSWFGTPNCDHAVLYNRATSLRRVNFMSAKLNNRQVGDVTVIDISGRITLGEGSSVIRDEMRALTGKGNKKVLLNLGDVTYIDSSGIGELVTGYTTMTNAGGAMKLLNLTKRVKDLLQITKLYTVFDVYEDEAHAVRSFA